MKFNRKWAALLLAFTLILGLVQPAFAEETGEEQQPQEASEPIRYTKTIFLRSAGDLLALAENCTLDSWSVGKRVVLKKDISLENVDFSPIPTFAGLFDGNGHTISGLEIDGSLTPAGLFGRLQPAGIVKDLTVSGTVAPAGDGQFVGGIAGENYGTITGCVFTGSVTGSGNTGGIAGINALSGKITDCTASGSVIGSDMTGGIAGCNLGTITACVNKANVNTTGADPTIDPADINFDFLTDISKLTSLDVSSAATDTGGIAGYSSGILTDCRNKASVGYPHIGYNVGGIVGRSCGYITACDNTAPVTGRKDVGGIAGQMEPYVAKNLTESDLARLERQLQELDALLDTATEHAEGASGTLTRRLNGIASSVGSAASAAQDIQTTGTISGNATGTVDGSTGGSITVTPIEGEIGGGIHVGKGSVSAGVGGSVSGGAEGEGNASLGAGLDAQAQINISTNIAGLSSALYGMAGQISMLSGELSGASEELLADVTLIKGKISEITTGGFDLLMGNDGGDLIIDDSTSIDIDQITLGKVYGCTNSATVTGDINIGGIAGDMGMEYALDPEDDLTISMDGSTKRKYEVRAIIQRCKNTGVIQSKRNYAGGIVGKMDLGLIAQCEAYGTVSSEDGNYVGGVAGICGSTIRHCFAKCSLSGGKYIGGIVGSGVEETKTGTSSTVAACYAIVTIADHGQYIGAISGAYAGTFLENYFVSEDLAGINRMSYTGCAQPLSYTQLLEQFETREEPEESPSQPDSEDGETEESVVAVPAMELPEEFKKFHLSFVAEGETLYSDVFDYGASFPEDVFPEIPQKKGYYAHWDRTELNDLRFDTTVTAVYEPYITALTGAETRDGGKAVFFAEGDFGETDTFTATSVALTPGGFPLPYGIWDTIRKSLTDGKVNTEVVEQWQLQISGADAAAHRIRYLPPNGDAQHMDVYAMANGEWVELDTEIIGSYVTFSVRENDVTIAVVHSVNTWWVWLIPAAVVLIVVFWVIRSLRKGKPASAPNAGAKKRRRRIFLPVILAVSIGILGTLAFLLLPELLAGKGACETIAAYLAKDTLSMELQVDAQIGATHFPIVADIRRTTANGEKVTAISQNDKTLYYAGGTVFLENGNAYKISDSLPDYSNLLEQSMELYRYIDVEAVGGTYSITATGGDAQALLELLIPSSASFLADPADVRVELVTERGELSQIRFSGSGHLTDAEATAYSVDAVLRILQEDAPVEIPEAVKDAVTSGDYGEAGMLSEDIYRLLSG